MRPPFWDTLRSISVRRRRTINRMTTGTSKKPDLEKIERTCPCCGTTLDENHCKLSCPKCGYFEVMIPKSDALHRTIAAEVIRKPARLSGPEFVFLRSELGMSARKLSKTIGVVHESISRWETSTGTDRSWWSTIRTPAVPAF